MINIERPKHWLFSGSSCLSLVNPLSLAEYGIDYGECLSVIISTPPFRLQCCQALPVTVVSV